MKKSFRVCILFAVCISVLMLFATNVSADMGPKPSITINTNGTVGEKYYLDLLVDYDSEYKNLSEEDISELDPEMYKALSEYTDGTWYPAIATERTLLFSARSFRTVTAQATSVTSAHRISSKL